MTAPAATPGENEEPRVNRRAFLTGTLTVLGVPNAARAQRAGRPWRIGYLSVAPDTGVWRERFLGFLEALRALGYTQGTTVLIEQRHAGGRGDRLAELAAELVALNIDVLVTFGSTAAARKATSTIPIVFVVEPDPVGSGLVASLRRPGGNVTGLSDFHADLVPKRLELLKEIVPAAARVGVLFNPATHYAPHQLRLAQAAAPAMGLSILPLEVRGSGHEAIDRAFGVVDRERPGGLLIVGDPTLGVHRSRIAELAVRHRLPTAGTARAWADGGLLLAYGANFADLFRRAATYVDRILKGASAADLPVEQPTTFELVVNLRTAKALGLTLPPSLLLRTDHVIE